MLSQQYRLKQKDQINHLLKDKLSPVLKTPLFIFKIRENHLESCRFCIVISKKFRLKGVARNRLRRQIYNALRLNFSILSKKKNLDCAIIVREPALKADSPLIKSTIITSLKKFPA